MPSPTCGRRPRLRERSARHPSRPGRRPASFSGPTFADAAAHGRLLALPAAWAVATSQRSTHSGGDAVLEVDLQTVGLGPAELGSKASNGSACAGTPAASGYFLQQSHSVPARDCTTSCSSVCFGQYHSFLQLFPQPNHLRHFTFADDPLVLQLCQHSPHCSSPGCQAAHRTRSVQSAFPSSEFVAES